MPGIFKDRRGAAAIEFAFVAPVFLLFAFIVLNVGLSLFTQVVLDNAVTQAGRQIQIGSATGLSLTSLKSFICGKALVMIPSCTTSLQVYATNGTSFSALTPATFTSTTMSPSTFSPGGSGSYVLLEVAYRRPYATGLLTGESGQLLVSASAFETEPY